jgi:RNA polymerase sigma-70 factor, ECF subfamily
MPDFHSHDAFVELLTQYRSQLFGYIYALVRRLDDAEDLYQETALTMWMKFQEYQPGTNFLGWACTVARYRTANFLKSERRKRRYFGQALQEELAALQASVHADGQDLKQEALVDCMKKLSAADCELLKLCYGSRQSFRQVAEQLGRSPQSIYDSLSRIRHALLECIERTIARDEHPRLFSQTNHEIGKQSPSTPVEDRR